MNIPSLPQDKANHLAYGAAIFSVALLLAHFTLINFQIEIAFLTVVFVAFGKEANDARINWQSTGNPLHGPHGVELLDALATVFGGFIAALPLFIIQIPA
jgi:hypothetical protein